MSKIKALIALLGAVMLSSALASASASAAPAAWMLDGKTLAEDHKAEAPVFLGAVTDRPIVFTAGAVITIECRGNIDLENATIKEIVGEQFLAESMIFTECTATSPVTCTVPITIGTVPVQAEVTLDGPLAIKGIVKPQTGGVFTTIAVTGPECAGAGNKPVTGDFEVLAPEGQDERTDQLVEFKQKATGLLRFGSSSATLTGAALLLLANESSWSFL